MNQSDHIDQPKTETATNTSATATLCVAHTEFFGPTMANASDVPAKILAMTTSARLTAVARSTSPTRAGKRYLCRFAASSRSKDSARDSSSSRAIATSSATTTQTAEATTSAVQLDARTFAICQSTSKLATPPDDRITKKNKRQLLKKCPKRTCVRSRERAALQPSAASPPASRHLRSLGSAAELK